MDLFSTDNVLEICSPCFGIVVVHAINPMCYLLCVPLHFAVLVLSPAKAMILNPATRAYSTEANVSGPGSHLHGSSAEDSEREKTKCLPGFIFLCNMSTKLQCYQYRVFGLPFGRMEVVEKIKIGSKLFLFDFKSKLLYGAYEATCDGNLNLEPAAFGGQFPAQV